MPAQFNPNGNIIINVPNFVLVIQQPNYKSGVPISCISQQTATDTGDSQQRSPFAVVLLLYPKYCTNAPQLMHILKIHNISTVVQLFDQPNFLIAA